MSVKSITAPIATIEAKVDGVLTTVGYMKSIKVTETISRVTVKGIGRLFPKERPVVDWNGSMTANSVFIDLKKAGLQGSPNRLTNDPEKFANTLLLNEEGIQVTLYRKVKDVVNPTTHIVEQVAYDKIATIEDLFIESDGFDISIGQVSGRDQSFSYTKPILFDSVV